MAQRRQVRVPLDGLSLTDARHGTSVDLGALRGVHVLILMRHRH